jgi:hypothetical protein
VGARDRTPRARPFAYTSYVLLGVAGAAVVADGALIWLKNRPVESVALLPVPGGALVATSGRW